MVAGLKIKKLFESRERVHSENRWSCPWRQMQSKQTTRNSQKYQTKGRGRRLCARQTKTDPENDEPTDQPNREMCDEYHHSDVFSRRCMTWV